MTPEIEEALGKPDDGSLPSESFIDHPDSAEIYTFLRGTPKEYNYLLTPAARKDILHRLSWFLLSKDDRLAELVPLDERTGGAPREELQDELEVPIEYTEVRRGQPCGHVFKRGEGVYRCKNCSMDDTCVLCTRCFQATDHTGHDTSFSVNSGTGGCCDCGDPEAWKIPLRCRHHSSFEELEEVGLDPIISSAGAPFVPGYKNNSECPVSVRRSIELTIAIVLEFILETFATSPINLTQHFDEMTIIEDATNASMALGDHEQQTKFAVVLWNDEVHSFQDVIDQCTEALQCSQMEAKKIAETVDASGRDVLRVSTSIPELIDIATTMTNVSLSVSIRAARDIFREQLSASLLIWLRDLACCKFRPLARVFEGKINNEIRAEISHQLCLRWVAPYRNVYLADILEKQYDFNLPDSDSGDEGDNMDEDDPEEYEDSLDGDDDRRCVDADIVTEAHAHADSQHDGMYHNAFYPGFVPQAPMSVDHGSGVNNISNASMPVGVPDSQHMTGNRGLRRRRSESEDVLRQQGDQRASPRGFSFASDGQGGSPPQSMWLAETSGRSHVSSVPSTIQAAMGAAIDAMGVARNSLARIMHPPSSGEGLPQHSLVPGAFPHAAAASMHSDAALSSRNANMAAHTHEQQMAMHFMDSSYDMETAISIDRVLRGCGQQRLDWFLIFDLQLWKEVRSGLRELYMATLMLDSKYKMKIALTFARNYPRLSRAFLTQDRAPEHSVLLFSVQLFTAPTLSASLVDHHRFMYIILDVLKKFFVQPTPDVLQRCGVILCDTESFRNRRYFHVFHDMRYLAGTPQVRNWVSSQHRFLATYVGFIGLFQGMNPNRRAVLEHVEFEADTWVNAFNVTLQVAKSCRQFAECYGISARDLFFAMRGTLRKLHRSVLLMAEENCSFIIRSVQAQGHLPHGVNSANNVSGDTSDNMQLHFEMHTLSTLWEKRYTVVRYDVSTSPVSFHHPLHWFMAELCQHVKHLTDDRARDFGFATVRDMIFSAFDTRLDDALEEGRAGEPLASANQAQSGTAAPLYSMSPESMNHAQLELLRILDYSIRVCVVMAQIRAGLWVRNGYVIRSQSHHYREVSLRENTYDQDIVLIQFFLSIWPDPDHILITLLDRFGLCDWLSGRTHVPTVYEPSHMYYMVEEFLNVLIVLVSERHVATGKNALDLARREIVHGCLSPISYSELSKKIPERLAEHTEFDNLLQQMANYRGPVSVLDFGLYELKDEFLDEVDPYFIHYSRNQREEVEELLRERLKKRVRKNGGEADEVPAYIPPKLEPIRFGPFQRIGMVLHTPLACQVLFYALFHATHTQNDLLSETMVDEALQLIVIALEDGRRGAVAREIGGPDVGNPGDSSYSPDRGGLWKYALEQGYPAGRGAPLNLLGLVLTLGLKPEMKQWKPKLNYIYQLFREGGPRIVGCIDDYYANLEATPIGSRVLRSAMEETKAAERKKKAAQARQAAILAEFANRQQDFMAQYGDEYDDLSDDDNFAGNEHSGTASSSSDKGKAADTSRLHKPLWGAANGACIVCQEECDGTKPYGILTLVQASRAVRDAPLADATQVVDILRLPGELDTAIDDSVSPVPQSPDESTHLGSSKTAAQSRMADYLGTINQVATGAYGAPSGLKGFPVLYHQRGLAASTCGHLMHMRCFMQYCQGVEAKRQQQPTRNHPENPHRKEFLCPLCKSLGNVLLPSLPYTADYDPLTIADASPERFAQPASVDAYGRAQDFERWISDEWLPFGKILDMVAKNQVVTDPATAPTQDSSGSAPVEADQGGGVTFASETSLGSTSTPNPSGAPSGTGAAATSTSMVDSAVTGFANALRNSGSFPMNLADGLADSIPRLDALLRSTQRLPGGLNIQALLSRFLPQLSQTPFGVPPGTERLALPISLYVNFLAERQISEYNYHQAHAQGRRQQNDHTASRRNRGVGNSGSSQCSTPDGSGVPSSMTSYPPVGNPVMADRVSSEQESRIREQMETYQYMYTRFYDVLQSVQRDNYVGLPSPSLFEHLTRSKDKNSTSASLGHSSYAANKSQYGDGNDKGDNDEGDDDDDDDEEEDEDEDDDEDEDEDDYMYHGGGGSNIPGASGYIPDSPTASLQQFMQNIIDHLRMLGAGGAGSANQTAGLQALANSFGSAGISAQNYGTNKLRPYPFERAAGSLFAYTIEMLELSQRGVRNPPVFDHEDSRTLPSGTLSDSISEPNAIFLHSLGKIPELHYRMIFGAPSDITKSNPTRANMQTASATPAQRLYTLLAETQSTMAIPAGMPTSPLSRTRLDMIKDLSYALAPLSGTHSSIARDALNEQSRWNTGCDGMPPKPFLMQDTFALLTETSLSLVIPFGIDVWHLVRLFVTAELVRACVAVGDSILGEYSGAPKSLRIAHHLPIDVGNGADVSNSLPSCAAPGLSSSTGDCPSASSTCKPAGVSATVNHVPQPWVDAPEAHDAKLLSLLSSGSDISLLEASAPGIQALVVWAIRQLQGSECDEAALKRLLSAVNPVTVTKLVTALMLPFLRRVALLFYLQYGVDIASEAPWLISDRQKTLESEENSQVLSQSEPECKRLLKLLHLPELHQIIDLDGQQRQPRMLSLIEGWLGELRAFRRRHSSPMSLGAGCTMAIPISMPTLYSLVDLPDRFEVLFERSAKAFCPRCNGVPSDPALCLLCGGFVCAQSFCCEEDGIGECNMHMKTCGGTVGVYLLVKKCGLLLLHHDNGCFMSAPYLDQHGEVDLGLKRGRPLFINRNRYDEMKKLVLTQKIPVFVARKIDQAFDIGGWVSL